MNKQKQEGAAVPIEVKKNRGTLNVTLARRKAEISLPQGNIPGPPEGLSEIGIEAWGRIALQLSSVGIFFASCYEYLESYCRALDIRESTWAELKDGVLEDGKIKPAWRAYQEAVHQMIVIGAKLGLTPVDKTKISSLVSLNADKNKQKKVGPGVRG